MYLDSKYTGSINCPIKSNWSQLELDFWTIYIYILMKFTTFRRLALSPSSGEERTRKEGGVWSVRVSELKSKVNKVKIGINCQSYTVGSLRMS
jgi:hypothetical protein